MLFTALFSVASLLAGAVADPAIGPELQPRQGGGFTTQNWGNDYAEYNYTSGAGGAYAIDWNNNFGGNFVVGKGYRPGGDMLFNYTGTFKVNGNAYLALYGWTTNPLVEYYVIESMGQHNPSDNASATQYGYVDSDGGRYEIWQKVRTNAPSIIGTATFQQYWSIRTKMHCGGTINTGNHFKAWKAAGLALGTQNYMVMGIEGQQGRGNANITVGALPTVAVPETPTPTGRTAIRTSTRLSTSTRRTTTSISTRRTSTSTSSPKPPSSSTPKPPSSTPKPSSSEPTSTGDGRPTRTTTRAGVTFTDTP